jgi:hypothetical protein
MSIPQNNYFLSIIEVIICPIPNKVSVINNITLTNLAEKDPDALDWFPMFSCETNRNHHAA